MMNVISVDGLRRGYFRKRVLENVSFALPRGSVTGLVGENGAGKTTLLKLLLGLLEPEAGEIRVFNMPAFANGLAVRQRAGYVPDEFMLYSWMTAPQLCRFVGVFYPTWDAALADRLLTGFALPPATKVKNYSKGMKMRLLLTLALAPRPELLILDEPFSGLDPVVRDDVLKQLSEFAATEGNTILISSHQLADIERLCDRLLLLHHGAIRIAATIEELKTMRCELQATFSNGIPPGLAIGTACEVGRAGNTLTLYCRADAEALAQELAAAGAEVETLPLDLEAIFRREVTTRA